MQGTANVTIYVTTRRIGRPPILRRGRSQSHARGKQSQDETGPGRSVQISVDRYTQVDPMITLTTKPILPTGGGSLQPPHMEFNPSNMPAFPAMSFYPPMYPPMGATDNDLETQREL
jgi:hypothetical protein